MNTTIVNVKNLNDKQLDWAVAKSVGVEYTPQFRPSKSFYHLQMLMLENGVETVEHAHDDGVTAFFLPTACEHDRTKSVLSIKGENIRVAASRLIVLHKLGDSVEVPVNI